MSNYQIITDGSCDLTEKEVKDLGVIVIPFYISIKKGEHLKVGDGIQISSLYDKMVNDNNLYPKTAQPTPEDYLKVFKEVAKNGKDIITICIAKNFSGSFNSASIAKDMLLEDFPDTKVTIVDSTLISLAHGLLVKEVCRMQKNNLSYDEVLSKLDKLKKSGTLFFTVNDLSYLHHGGRIGKVSALIGKTLRLNVIIQMKDSAIKSTGKALSRARSLMQIQAQVAKYIEKIGEKIEHYIFSVGYGHSQEEGLNFKEKISLALNTAMSMNQVGATIAVHTGPQAIGVALIKKYDV